MVERERHKLNFIDGVVVPSRKANPEAVALAEDIAGFLDWTYEPYGGSIAQARKRNDVEFSIVVSKKCVRLTWEDGEFEYHPGMAIYRIGNDRPSPFIAALRPRWGERTLDTTLGFGRDAMQIADRTEARVVGFERNAVMALLTHLGLKKLQGTRRFRKVCPRVSVSRGDGFRYMKSCARGQYDLVLLDPMFPKPVKGSRDMEVLHKLVDAEDFDHEVLRDAARVARRRAVLRWPVDKPLPDFPFRYVVPSQRGRFLHLTIDASAH